MDDSHLGCAMKLQSSCKLRLQSREGLTRTGGSISFHDDSFNLCQVSAGC